MLNELFCLRIWKHYVCTESCYESWRQLFVLLHFIIFFSYHLVLEFKSNKNDIQPFQSFPLFVIHE